MARTPRPRALALLVVTSALLVPVGAAPAAAAEYKSCGSISNPYAGTKYNGVDIRRIRALRVSCRVARKVAKRAHRKGLGLYPNSKGILSYRWRRWNVTGDLRGDDDRYVAKRRGLRRVRWRF